MIKPISISLSPNTEKDDIWLAFRMIFQPWRWQKGKEIAELEDSFRNYLGVRSAVAMNSGRSAFMAILQSLELEQGSEVLLQAFTCNAVPNPVQWTGLRPVYVDCQESDFNMSAQDLERKITHLIHSGRAPKAVIVQHTFGIPADLDTIMEVCRKHNLILIEDCAHALGAQYKGRLVGTFGKAAIFSFSRDKVISCVYGGMATTNDEVLSRKIRSFQQSGGNPSLFWIFQQLLHPVLMNAVILPTYRVFGKYLLILFQSLGLLSKAVHWKEKRGQQPGYFPKALPAALAILAFHQLKKLERLNLHRKEIASFYAKALHLPQKEGIFLRFPLVHPKAHEIIKKFWDKNILVGDWYTSPVAPDDTLPESVGYQKGSCPVAEKLSSITLNLPTHITISQQQAEKIINLLKRLV